MRLDGNPGGVSSTSRGRLVVCLMVLGLFLLSIVATGCGAGLGETTAEANRRRQRVLRINLGQMITDIDRVLMLDEPSRLTDRDLP